MFTKILHSLTTTFKAISASIISHYRHWTAKARINKMMKAEDAKIRKDVADFKRSEGRQ